MKYINHSIKIYNKSIKKQKEQVKNNNYEKTLRSVYDFRNIVVNIDNYLLFLFKINNYLINLENSIINFLNKKLNINHENNIFLTLFDYLIPQKFNTPIFETNYKKNINLFIKKAYHENIINDYDYYYNDMKNNLKYNTLHKTNILYKFHYKYTDLISSFSKDYNNYNNNINIVYYWLNIDNDNFVKHYYMQYYLII